MPQILPLIPSEEHYEFSTEIDGSSYLLEVRWNDRDEVWRLSVFELDGAPIFEGQPIVLGTFIGRTARHRLTSAGALIAVDTARSGIDAGLHDLGDGSRVLLTYWTGYEIAAAVRAYAEALRLA